jgi:ATP-dependent Lhr-like helicase
MGLVLQQSGIARDELSRWLEPCPAFTRMGSEARDSIVNWMLEQQILFAGEGLLAFGPKGEEAFGRKNFLELFSVFLSPPLFTVLHGRQELGFVDELIFLGKKDGPRVLLLGGRSWAVKHVDWQRKIAHVEPTDAKGHSRWKGEGQGLGFALCQAVHDVLATDTEREFWSRRALERMAEVRHEYDWLTLGTTVLLRGKDGDAEWWTFGGLAANAMLAGTLTEQVPGKVDYDNFAITLKGSVTIERCMEVIGALRGETPERMRAAIDPSAGDGRQGVDPSGLVEDALVGRAEVGRGIGVGHRLAEPTQPDPRHAETGAGVGR